MKNLYLVRKTKAIQNHRSNPSRWLLGFISVGDSDLSNGPAGVKLLEQIRDTLRKHNQPLPKPGMQPGPGGAGGAKLQQLDSAFC